MHETDTSLEEMMVAMDAIDEIRHQERVVRQELDEPARRATLKEKLKAIYAERGIQVDDATLEAGIKALEEERFEYKPKLHGWRRMLAQWYVRRDRWLKPLGWTLLAGTVAWGVYFASVVWPHRHRLETLRTQTQSYMSDIRRIAQERDTIKQAQNLRDAAIRAIDDDRLDDATRYLDRLAKLDRLLGQHLRIRIVQEPGKRSGIWRIPPHNPTGKNYYLIVEALDDTGKATALPIRNEETGKVEEVTRWGVRVDRDTFEKVARDKRDDGIIEHRIIGEKERGKRRIRYAIPVRNGAVTRW